MLVDPIPGRGHDELRLSFDKEWKSGKLYRFEIRGRLPLEGAELMVRGLEGR